MWGNPKVSLAIFPQLYTMHVQSVCHMSILKGALETLKLWPVIGKTVDNQE